MNEASEFFQKLFDTSDFPPRWHCGYWSQFHGWLYILSDLAIWAAYFVIPVIIVNYISKRYSIQFTRIYFLFAAFILACGGTHLLDAIMFWYPYYRINAIMRFITAVISWVTVFSIARLFKHLNLLRSSEQFEQEIENRKAVEAQLHINNNLLKEALEIAKLGHWKWDVLANKVQWSDMTIKLFGLPEGSNEMSYEDYLATIHPDDKDYVNNAITEGFKSKSFPKFYHRIILPDGRIRTMLSKGEAILDDNGQVVQMIGTVQDITELINTEHELLLKSQRLESSNVELQKFASITSHDLREPLRKILTFGSMLEKDSTSQISEKGKIYLSKVTEASNRMQKLIDNILDFSKLTVDNTTFAKVSLNEIIAHVLSDMEIGIEAVGGKVEVATLPEIYANSSQLGQLFQNLIGNALKFRKRDEAPIVKIWHEVISGAGLPGGFQSSVDNRLSIIRNSGFSEAERYCKIYIQDNGIGFDEEYLDKIFLIFQRLHSKSEYEGTGIGLAVVKKVTDLHNGYITATSKPGVGTTFIIILPFLQIVPSGAQGV